MRRIRCAAAYLLLALLWVPGSGSAESEDERLRWVPSFSPFFAALAQKASGSVTAGEVLGSPLTEGGCLVTAQNGSTSRNGDLCPVDFNNPAGEKSPRALVPDTRSSDTGIASLVGGSLELMAPRLYDGLFSPRLFVHVDAARAFAFERNLAGERKPGSFAPPPQLFLSTVDIAEIAVTGQGSRTTSQVRPFVFSAGGGVAFTADLFRRRVRLKPSFEYLRQEQKLRGRAYRAVKLEVDRDASDDATLADFRTVVLSTSKQITQHALGAGLELEADSGRLGPFVLSLFIGGRGYRTLGALDHTLVASNEFGETVRFDVEFEPYAWRADAGLRFRWVPE